MASKVTLTRPVLVKMKEIVMRNLVEDLVSLSAFGADSTERMKH